MATTSSFEELQASVGDAHQRWEEMYSLLVEAASLHGRKVTDVIPRLDSSVDSLNLAIASVLRNLALSTTQTLYPPWRVNEEDSWSTRASGEKRQPCGRSAERG